MFERNKKTGCQTPKFRRQTSAPKPKPNPNYVPPPTLSATPPNRGSSVQPNKKDCIYETPCHWCSKWDKKCDLKIGCENPSRELRANAMLYDAGIAPCVYCKKHKIDKDHCLICWAHNFNSFEVKENKQ